MYSHIHEHIIIHCNSLETSKHAIKYPHGYVLRTIIQHSVGFRILIMMMKVVMKKMMMMMMMMMKVMIKMKTSPKQFGLKKNEIVFFADTVVKDLL